MNKGILVCLLVVILALGGAGGYFFLVHRPNQPTVRYVPVAEVGKLSEPEQERMMTLWKKISENDEVMGVLVKHTKVASIWGMSDEATITELRSRLHLKVDKKGLQVGFTGKRKETADLNNLAQSFFGYGAQLISKNDEELGRFLNVK